LLVEEKVSVAGISAIIGRRIVGGVEEKWRFEACGERRV
jgi:hypothetical protein